MWFDLEHFVAVFMACVMGSCYSGSAEIVQPWSSGSEHMYHWQVSSGWGSGCQAEVCPCQSLWECPQLQLTSVFQGSWLSLHNWYLPAWAPRLLALGLGRCALWIVLGS